MGKTVEKMPKKNKAWEKVYWVIREDINNYRYKPGEVLSEIEIAKDLGVSRTPVAMALNYMEQEKLVVNKNGKKEVARISVEELKELFDVKISLQASLSKWAAERKTPEQTRELESILQEIEEYLRSPFDDNGVNDELTQKWLPLDNRFHSLIHQMANSPMASKIIDDCDIKWHIMRFSIIALGERTKKNAEDHLKIAQSIIEGHGENAAELMKNHLIQLRDSVIHIMGTFQFK